MEEQLTEIMDLLCTLCRDSSISKNVRLTLEAIKTELDIDTGELGVKIDSALQKVEDLTSDPNLSTYSRTQIWNLTSMLEAANNSN